MRTNHQRFPRAVIAVSLLFLTLVSSSQLLGQNSPSTNQSVKQNVGGKAKIDKKALRAAARAEEERLKKAGKTFSRLPHTRPSNFGNGM